MAVVGSSPWRSARLRCWASGSTRGGAVRRSAIDLYFADGSLVSLDAGSPEAARSASACARRSPRRALMKREELAAALREHAYLEGDFVLRSGKRSNYYLDKYRFETRPDLLAALGEHIAAAVAEHEPDAVRLAGPELGAVALAAAASLVVGAAVPDRPQGREGVRDGESARRALRAGRAHLPRRGRRHVWRRRGGGSRCAPRGRSGVPNCGLRGRSRGGWSGRSGPPWSPSRAPVSGRRLARGAENRRKTVWLSRNSLAVRLRLRITEPFEGGCT